MGRPEDALTDLPKTGSLLVDDLQLADAKESLALPRGTTNPIVHNTLKPAQLTSTQLVTGYIESCAPFQKI